MSRRGDYVCRKLEAQVPSGDGRDGLGAGDGQCILDTGMDCMGEWRFFLFCFTMLLTTCAMQAAAKKMSKAHKTGAKIVFVASTLAYMTFIGWASYAPGKHALRGLADTLYSELKLYGIDVQIYFPNTMYTPGFEEEGKTKPEITRRIESGDEGCTPEQAAQALYKGASTILR